MMLEFLIPLVLVFAGLPLHVLAEEHKWKKRVYDREYWRRVHDNRLDPDAACLGLAGGFPPDTLYPDADGYSRKGK